jgi:ribosomal protein L30E
MSEIIKDGKKPLSSKKKPEINQITADDLGFGNALHLPPALQQELDDQGLEGYWMNATQLFHMGGYHPKGWMPYKRKGVGASLSEFKIGTDPDGIIRRGDCILGVKTTTQAAKQREFLQERSSNLKKNNESKAKELKQYARQQGVEITVHEGYEENE